ncbi:unnamed protein product, partial [Phytomonas sp. Hart1]
MNRVIPPAQSGATSATMVRNEGFKILAGILRWNGRHYYLLLSLLFTKRRLEEVRRVWAVMKAIGFMDYHMDDKTVNSYISLIRRGNERSAGTMVYTDKTATTGQLSDEKALRRQLLIELEEIAKKKGFSLQDYNLRATQLARITEFIQESPSLPLVAHTDKAINGKVVKDAQRSYFHNEDRNSATANCNLLKVGDFNGLLRVSQSLNKTQRILAVMEKLEISKCTDTYSSLIASLHNPEYLLSNDPPPTINFKKNESIPLDGEKDVEELNEGKAKYENYKNQRIAQAKIWFDACPTDQRTASLYNEMLYLLRDKSRVDEFNALLVEFRGNALRAKADKPNNTEGPDAVETLEAPTCAEDNGPILPPQWCVPPNSKTYELLIQHVRYLEDWEAFWEVYGEMGRQNVKGTSRLYHVLLKEIKQHPPPDIKHSGESISNFIVKLSEKMELDGVRIISVDEGMKLVDAWSATRKR